MWIVFYLLYVFVCRTKNYIVSENGLRGYKIHTLCRLSNCGVFLIYSIASVESVIEVVIYRSECNLFCTKHFSKIPPSLLLREDILYLLVQSLKHYRFDYGLPFYCLTGEYSQEIPANKPWEKVSGPPILPPHLLQVILNKDTPLSVSTKWTTLVLLCFRIDKHKSVCSET